MLFECGGTLPFCCAFFLFHFFSLGSTMFCCCYLCFRSACECYNVSKLHKTKKNEKKVMSYVNASSLFLCVCWWSSLSLHFITNTLFFSSFFLFLFFRIIKWNCQLPRNLHEFWPNGMVSLSRFCRHISKRKRVSLFLCSADISITHHQNKQKIE